MAPSFAINGGFTGARITPPSTNGDSPLSIVRSKTATSTTLSLSLPFCAGLEFVKHKIDIFVVQTTCKSEQKEAHSMVSKSLYDMSIDHAKWMLGTNRPLNVLVIVDKIQTLTPFHFLNLSFDLPFFMSESMAARIKIQPLAAAIESMAEIVGAQEIAMEELPTGPPILLTTISTSF
ncbi:hypothetical protein PIB30_000360 [Stylosanthes scabra]|uniref:Uncharacterized protein n=1 Tax=Stylosanthes scabra TaxID=79078 RepID=A0ABU6U4Y0_9FABA|nr:hypothetical protein [Stylosanthes scabra]